MQTQQIQMTDVTYNAGTQCFEALVTINEGDRARKYACAVEAPMWMSFNEAADGLTRQAHRRHAGRGGMFSETRRQNTAQRAGRPRPDAKSWIERLVKLPGSRAA